MKEATYNVRVTFVHGNGITLDCRGCGQIYLKPNKDYFFENAPLKFINYLAQLKRLGITYKITADKRGCYQTFNLLQYTSADPFSAVRRIRSNKVASTLNKKVQNKSVNTEVKPQEDKLQDFLDSKAQENIEEVEPPLDSTEETEVTISQTPEDSTEVTTTEETTVTSETNTELTEDDTETPDTTWTKKELINYAHTHGLTQVDEAYTKKEIVELINSSK